MTIITNPITTPDRIVCDDCGQGWQAAVTADLSCACGSTNLTVTEQPAVAAWLNIDEIVNADLRAEVGELKDATLQMLRAIEAWAERAGDIGLRYEAATDIRYEEADMEGLCEVVDKVTGYEVVRELLRLADAVIAAHLDPGDMPMEFDQMAKSTAEHLSTIETRSPIMRFIVLAENEVERRADRREALGHLR